ncbi:MAG: YhfZ family protein [Arachnia sp.]
MAIEWVASSGLAQGGLHAAVRAVVLDALSKSVGDTLMKNSDFRDELGLGVGTVQRAIDLLADRAALRTVSRGHLGRRIESVDIGQSWQAAGLPPIQISLSPPGSVEIDALEGWLSHELIRIGVPFSLAHTRGGNHRLEQLDQAHVDFTVVSAGTYAGLAAAHGSVEPSPHRLLGGGTYYSPERLLVLSTRGLSDDDAPERIAIDHESFDHEALTLAQFPPHPRRHYVQVPFLEVPGFVLAGVVDAGVWHQRASAVPLSLTGLISRPMWGPSTATRDQLSGATIVTRSGRPELRSVMDALDIRALATHRDDAIAAETTTAERLSQALLRAQDPARA